VRGGEDVGAGVRDRGDTHFIRDQQAIGDEFGGFLVIRQGFVGVHLVLGRPERAEAEFLRVVGVAGNTPEHFARGGARGHAVHVGNPNEVLLIVPLVIDVGALRDREDRHELIRDVTGRAPTHDVVRQHLIDVKIAASLQGHCSLLFAPSA
jgi:hypothetical protein